MKPGKGLQRRKGLTTRTPLLPKQPLKRIPATGSSWVQPKRSKPLTTKPKAPTKEEKDGREVVKQRSLVGEVRMCEITIPGVCTGRATDFHHRKNRSQGGTWEPVNGLAACRRCHSTVTDTRAEYYANGWCVESHQDPAEIPVLYRGRWGRLTDDGGLTPVEKGKAA